MKQDLQSRIQRMYQQDCWMAWLDIICIWCAVGFVLISMLQIVQDSQIRLALAIGSISLLIFNTASVKAMTRHYADDKDYIYGIDIKHLDAAKAKLSQP